jgi:hypothetical protein
VGFHESFWLAAGAAAPVITLAAVVALPDSSAALRGAFALRWTAELRKQEAEARKREAMLLDALKAEDEATRRLAELRKEASRSSDPAIRSLAEPHRETDVPSLDENLIRAIRDVSDEVPAGRKKASAKGLYESAMLILRISLGNVIIQAGLLAVSLAALAYHRDVVPPWMAIVLAVGGILLLAWTSVAGALIRTQRRNRDFNTSNDPPFEAPDLVR